MSNSQPKRTTKSQYATLYSTLMAFYVHQDRLMWSRVHFLIAVHVAVLAGGLTQADNWVGPAIMLLGALITCLITVIMLVDQAVRDKNVPMMEKIEDELVPKRIKNELSQEGKADRVQLSVKLPPWATRLIVGSVLGVFLGIDIVVAYLFAYAPHLFPSVVIPPVIN